MTNPIIVCVLGAHRSGTSLVTRILNLLGVYLGPEDHLMKPGVWNPKGYWEHMQFKKSNNDIISKFGGKWYEPPDFPEGWEMSPELEVIKQQAQSMIQADFAGAEIWGWKDPATCLTFPFWQQLLPPIRSVICLRSPIEMARSLRRRKYFSLEKGIYLWLVYTKSALDQSVARNRALVFYDDVLSNWREVLEQLSHFLGKPERAQQAEVLDKLHEFIDPELHHFTFSARETTDNVELKNQAELFNLAQQIYLELKREEALRQGGLDEMFHECLSAVKAEIEKQEQETDEL